MVRCGAARKTILAIWNVVLWRSDGQAVYASLSSEQSRCCMCVVAAACRCRSLVTMLVPSARAEVDPASNAAPNLRLFT